MHLSGIRSHLAWLFAALLLFAIAPARADSWAPPAVETYVSANGQYRLTVVPREIGSQLAYFEAKARGETLPEPEGPLGRFERLEDGQWVSVWSRALVNEVAPVDVLVGDDGRHVVSFDNWHSTGHGDHVVVLYGEGGSLVRSLRLDQIVPAYFIDALPASVSSIHWRRADPRFVGDRLEVAVAEPDGDMMSADSFPVRIALADGMVDPIAAERMATLTPRACAAHTRQVASFNEYLAFERGALAYPETTDRDDWRRYLHHAATRLRPAADDSALEDSADPFAAMLGETTFELLQPGEYMEKDYRDDFRLALAAPPEQLRRRWFAARDQDKLVAEVERSAKKIKPGQLTGVEMRFFADAAHWPRIAAALAASGATLVQVDIGVPIPARAEDVAELPPERMIDPACAGAY
ncbi:hypothetical protein [Sphingopyxis sp. KK2]|uniref:hypothetical protein n=1 Tax=Sphingopyxis sp. KK2 TaxID=1855727 RepID=UPI00097E62E8|nr:hypothetical protein [Sphingopyxis sp. KK2]